MERRPVVLEHSDVGTALRDEVRDDGTGCILQSLMGSLKVAVSDITWIN